MLGSHVIVSELLGILPGILDHFFSPGGERDFAYGFGFRSRRYRLADLIPDNFEINAHFFKNIDGNTLPELDEP